MGEGELDGHFGDQMTQHPFDFGQARQKARDVAQQQSNAEEALRLAVRAYADAERDYRKALALEIVRQHSAGIAWSSTADLARGDETVADLKHARDVAEGAKEAAVQGLWRHAANRRDLQTFIEWSMRRDLAEGFPDGDVVQLKGVSYGG